MRYFLLLILFFIGNSCKEDASSKASSSAQTPVVSKEDAHLKMVQELRYIADDKSDLEMWHRNEDRAKQFDQLIQETEDNGEKITMLFQSGMEYLNAGQYENAIIRLKFIVDFVNSQKLKLPKETDKKVRELYAVAHLRKAEVENCIANHNAFSCILPIDEKGQHLKREGSEAALKILESLLSDYPDDLQIRWLYNLTQMTLGNYPGNIPKALLIPKNTFNSDAGFPRFQDRAMQLDLAVNDIAGSVIMEDFNNDHHLDLMVSSYGLDDQLKYFENDGAGGFRDMTSSAGLNGMLSGLNMVQADYNNDGWMDFFILRGAWLGKYGNHPNSLIRNNGDGSFTDVTKSSGLYSLFPTQTATWLDFNNDGQIDLFIANEHSPTMNAVCQLYKNNGNGTFSDVAKEHGLNVQAFIKACNAADFDHDGNMDIYLSCINGANYLMKNGGKVQNYKFSNVAKSLGVSEPNYSFSCWFFDYNQDGWDDIFVSGFDFSQFETAANEVAKDHLGQKVDAELPRLYQNDQKGGFTEISKKARVDKVLFTMGCNYGDLNNDGYPDFYAGTGTPDFRALIPNKMFLNDQGNKFLDVTTVGGFGHLQKGHGIAFGDIDHDGDQDIYHVLGGSYDGDNFMNALFVNPGFKNQWVKIKLIGVSSNKSAIGAKLRFNVLDEKGNRKSFFNKVGSGASFGANSLTVHQGLGDCQTLESLELTWPGETTAQKIEGLHLQLNNLHFITQNETEIKRMKIDQLKLKENNHHHHHSSH